MIVDCEARIWDLRAVDFEDPDIASFWDAMMDHGRILTRERESSDRAFWTERNVADQIQALRTFEIPARLREEWGYPEITDKVRAKLLGGNAARLLGLQEAVAEDGIV